MAGSGRTRTVMCRQRQLPVKAQAACRSRANTLNWRLTRRWTPRQPVTVRIISAMTNFDKSGFSIGPGAFATPQETQATVLQELYRLNTTVAGATGVHSGESAALELDAARKFVDKVLRSGVMDQ